MYAYVIKNNYTLLPRCKKQANLNQACKKVKIVTIIGQQSTSNILQNLSKNSPN